jgi:hypothetical protein
MSEAYARHSQPGTMAGGVMVTAISLLAAILVIAGVSYAASTGERHQAALAAAGCEPNLSPSGLQCTTVHMLVGKYMNITTPAIQQLRTDVSAYTASERRDLTAAKSALMAEVTVENSVDTSLARFPFPPAAAPLARALIRDNQVRARLTAEQARSTSFTQLRSFNRRVRAASAAVRTEMGLTRKALGSRPTASQEP